MKVKVGTKCVRDVVTGSEGVVVARCEYLTFAPILAIQTGIPKDQTVPPDVYWFSEKAAEIIDATIIKI